FQTVFIGRLGKSIGQPIPMPQRHSRYGIVHEGRTLSDARARWNALCGMPALREIRRKILSHRLTRPGSRRCDSIRTKRRSFDREESQIMRAGRPAAVAASRSLSRDLLQCVEACLLLGGQACVEIV